MGKRMKKGGISWWMLALLAFLAGALFAILVFNRGTLWGPPEKGQGERVARLVPTVEVPRKIPEAEVPRVAEAPPIVPEAPMPMVAIVIDDLGQDLRKLDALFEVDAPITVAVLPHQRYSRKVAEEAYLRKGWEVLLHLPMEPKGFEDGNGKDPGKGALLTGMAERDVRRIVEEGLDDVPYASGINNHMGSKFTEDVALMRAVMGVVKENGLFFLDSRTTSASVAKRLASTMGARFAGRNVFLDNSRDPRYIKGQIDELIMIARKRGRAIAIGHPYPETIETLKERMPDLRKEGVQAVRLSELIDGGGAVNGGK